MNMYGVHVPAGYSAQFRCINTFRKVIQMDVANEPRDTVIYVRVSKGERIRIQEYAEAAGMSTAEYARRCMLRSMRGSPLSGLEKILLHAIHDKDLTAVRNTLQDIIVFLNDLRRKEDNDSNHKAGHKS